MRGHTAADDGQRAANYSSQTLEVRVTMIDVVLKKIPDCRPPGASQPHGL